MNDYQFRLPWKSSDSGGCMVETALGTFYAGENGWSRWDDNEGQTIGSGGEQGMGIHLAKQEAEHAYFVLITEFVVMLQPDELAIKNVLLKCVYEAIKTSFLAAPLDSPSWKLLVEPIRELSVIIDGVANKA